MDKRTKAIIDKLHESGEVSSGDVARLVERVETLARLDREAATYCEGPICMRTHFTGEEPYVGWKGLGKAMEEAFDERDRLREQITILRNGMPAKPDGVA